MIIWEKQTGANPPERDHTTRAITQGKRRSNVLLELQLGKNKSIFEVYILKLPLSGFEVRAQGLWSIRAFRLIFDQKTTFDEILMFWIALIENY